MDTPIRILMVEDSAPDAELVCQHLQKAGLKLQATVVDDEERMRSALEAGRPDIILSDFTLPGFDGLTAFEIALQTCPDVPFIFHSATLDQERAHKAMLRGATEFVPKGRYERLTLAVERALLRSQLRQVRRNAEQALREKEQRLRDIVETAQDWIWELDAEGRFTFSNRAVRDILGYRPHHLQGKAFLEFLVPEDRSSLEHAFERMRTERYGMTGLVARWIGRSGGHRWLEKNVLPLFDTAGNFLGFRGSDRDITRRMVHELTGLPNRMLFCERVDATLPVLKKQGLPLIVFVFDLEHLTTINACYGRAAGDGLLVQMAARMKSLLGSTHSMAHLGGGMFAVVYTDLIDVQDAAYILRTEISRLFIEPFQASGETVRLTARSGLAFFPEDGASAEALLHHAEAALRTAKQSGEKFLRYDEEMDTEVLRRMQLEDRLEQAWEDRQLELHYQPFVSLQTGAIEGAEALIRWHDLVLGQVASEKFIPILESSDRIVEVGHWVLKEVASESLKWRRLGVPLRVSVNISPVQLKSPHFVEDILRVLGRGTDRAIDLNVEITENMLTGDISVTAGKLAILREHGVGISLDDFGTGYSSLSRLARLPIDTLKIDRSFVRDITRSDSARALVAAIIALARACNMKSLAEGVETREQYEMLRALGCDSAQGFLIGVPAPSEEFETMLIEGRWKACFRADDCRRTRPRRGP